MARFRIGDHVKKNPATWQPNDFDSWGRGVGVGVVVEQPFPIESGEVDVRWPAGRCFESKAGLVPAAGPQHPDIAGCAGGFGLAGMGIGSVLGIWIGDGFLSQLVNASNNSLATVAILENSGSITYVHMFIGIILGFLFGGITGTVYAVYKRRWLAVIDPRPRDNTSPHDAA